MDELDYIPAGDSAFLVKFDSQISEKTHRRILSFMQAIQSDDVLMKGIYDLVPSYSDLMIYYNPIRFSYQTIYERLKGKEEHIKRGRKIKSRIIEIPVYYGSEFGEDIGFVAKHNNLTVDQVIKIHAKPKYLIYMLGFTPGFSYLGGLSKQLTTPRRKEPRTLIPAGAVGIAGNQTGIYPIESPGGWQLIGRTPVKLFNPESSAPVILKAGDRISFKPISGDEYNEISKSVQAGEFMIRIR